MLIQRETHEVRVDGKPAEQGLECSGLVPEHAHADADADCGDQPGQAAQGPRLELSASRVGKKEQKQSEQTPVVAQQSASTPEPSLTSCIISPIHPSTTCVEASNASREAAAAHEVKDKQDQAHKCLYGDEDTGRDIPQGLKLLYELAGRGDSGSLRHLIVIHRKGLSARDVELLKPDPVTEFNLLLQADKTGSDYCSIFELGCRLFTGIGVAGSAPYQLKSQRLFTTEAWKQLVKHLQSKQWCDEHGRGLQPQQWIDRWELAAGVGGYSPAISHLGHHHFYGKDRNLKEAAKWFTKGAQIEDERQLDCIYHLALCFYEEDDSTESNLLDAKQLLQNAHTRGHKPATFLLGRMAVDQNQMEEACLFFYQAAEGRHDNALASLVRCLRQLGTGSAISANAAGILELLHQAKESGDAESMYEWSLCYRDGCSALQIEQAPVSALQLLESAARFGHTQAAYQAGLHYRDTSQFAVAIEFFQLGANRGDVDCTYEWVMLSGRQRHKTLPNRGYSYVLLRCQAEPHSCHPCTRSPLPQSWPACASTRRLLHRHA